MTDPATSQVWMKDVLVPDHYSIRTTLAGGVTTVKTIHGSANVIGGVNAIIKVRYDRPVEEPIVQDAPSRKGDPGLQRAGAPGE